MKKIVKKIKITAILDVKTGLHIGGNSESVEIGGIDNPVIKIATRNNQPYIPGSSLRGKMRCLLEQVAGATEVGGNEEVNKLFGFSKKGVLSKLIVRDALLTVESESKLRSCEALDMPYTEGKWENVIDRVKGVAEHPRQTERVPAGAAFDVNFVINVWEDDNEQGLLDLLWKGMRLLECDYLGGSGSRGYGQVEFRDIKRSILSEETNWKDSEIEPIKLD